jgi:membrane-associated PAP2 superfamily phosphatase
LHVSLDRTFWFWHLAVPSAIFLPLALLFESSNLDMWLATALYQWEGSAWALKGNWLTFAIMHQGGNILIYAFSFLVLLLAICSRWVAMLNPWKKSLTYLFVCMAAIPTVIVLLKHFSQVPCPWVLQDFGASRLYHHNLAYPLSSSRGGHCFPSGHASAGFALLSLYFAAYPGSRKNTWLFLLPGLILGASFGLAQQLRGAHFLSHDLWSAFLSWLIALLVFAVAQGYGLTLLRFRSAQFLAAHLPRSRILRTVVMSASGRNGFGRKLTPSGSMPPSSITPLV